MTKTFTAPFAQTPQTGFAECTAVATPADDTANTILIATAGADGALLTRLSAIPKATVTGTVLLLFISQDSGTTQHLVDAELLVAQTVDTTTAIAEYNFANISEDTPIRLKASDEVYVGITVAVAGGIGFTAEWTDF